MYINDKFKSEIIKVDFKNDSMKLEFEKAVCEKVNLIGIIILNQIKNELSIRIINDEKNKSCYSYITITLSMEEFRKYFIQAAEHE